MLFYVILFYSILFHLIVFPLISILCYFILCSPSLPYLSSFPNFEKPQFVRNFSFLNKCCLQPLPPARPPSPVQGPTFHQVDAEGLCARPCTMPRSRQDFKNTGKNAFRSRAAFSTLGGFGADVRPRQGGLHVLDPKGSSGGPV